MQRTGVRFRKDRYRRNIQIATGAHDADRDLSPICD
jgi:hypothetical protein